MAKKFMPRSGTNLTIGGVTVGDQLTAFSARGLTQMTNAQVFTTEGVQDQESGGVSYVLGLSGYLAYDDTSAFVPLPPPQNTAYVLTIYAFCTITGNFDCPDAGMGAAVGTMRGFDMTLLSKSPAPVIAWDTQGFL